MSITWLAPAAFAGLVLIALPIAIHLLVRQQTRTLLYPSLRFLRATALAAFRRRRIEDAILLLCRVAIIAAAALALAGPILHTPSRMASYAGRTARAHVDAGSSAPAVDGVLAEGAFRFASFQRVEIADAIRDALRWLGEQPPAAREIVFSGSFPRGSIDAADLLVIPADVGVRFAAAGHQAPPSDVIRSLVLRNGRLALVERRVALEADATRVADGAVTSVPQDRVRVIAAPRDQPLADAALRAALEAGIRWTTPERRVIVVWDGANPSTPETGVEIIRMAVPAAASSAADEMGDTLEASTPIQLHEPISIARAQLDAWSRTPGPPSRTATPGDEGDRRWLWGLALMLLAVEQWLRRAVAQPSISQEARVA
jgi:hypothetical protein